MATHANSTPAPAAPRTIPNQPDPVLLAISEWERAWIAAYGENSPDRGQEASDAQDEEDAREAAICGMIATTAAGLAAQLRFAFNIFSAGGDPSSPGYRRFEPYSEPEAYVFDDWTDGRDATLLANLLEAAKRLAKAEASA